MPQYLVRQFKDSTGHIHTNIEKARTNETLSIVEAGSKEEAKEEAKYILSQHDRLQLRKLYRLQDRLG